MSIFNQAHAQSTPPAPGGGGTTATTQVATGAPAVQQQSPMGMLVPFALMFVIIYFLIIRPQQKKMKEHQTQLEAIKHGDEIVGNGGLLGRVTGVTDKVLTVEIADGVRVKMLKSQVSAVNPNLTAEKTKSVEKGA